jgi:hypothetical protein
MLREEKWDSVSMWTCTSSFTGELPGREGHRIEHSVLEKLPQMSQALVHVETKEELTAIDMARVR